jgi:2-succinyl-6-hydroxy-2,4-cyclohexadiene-1-carboxylate synthase
VTRLLVHGVRYEVRLGGSGPALLLLHGFTGRGSGWAPHLPVLRRVATTIQVDLLGHGNSDAPADPARHAVERQAADLAEILRRVAGGHADVLGYSFGARVSLALAISNPTAVRRLVLESPSAGIADPRERAARRAADEALAGKIELDGVPAFVDRWESQPLFATQAALPEAARSLLHDERLRNDSAGLAGSLRGAGQGAMTPLHDRLTSVAAPTLVICGALDPVRPRAEAVAAGVPGARLELVKGAGHAVHLEAPAVFRSLVLSFIAAPQASLASSEEVV